MRVLPSGSALFLLGVAVQALSPLHNLDHGRSVFTCELLNLMEALKPAMPPTPRVPPIVPTELRKILKDRVDIFGNQDQQVAVCRGNGEKATMQLFGSGMTFWYHRLL